MSTQANRDITHRFERRLAYNSQCPVALLRPLLEGHCKSSVSERQRLNTKLQLNFHYQNTKNTANFIGQAFIVTRLPRRVTTLEQDIM